MDGDISLLSEVSIGLLLLSNKKVNCVHVPIPVSAGSASAVVPVLSGVQTVRRSHRERALGMSSSWCARPGPEREQQRPQRGHPPGSAPGPRSEQRGARWGPLSAATGSSQTLLHRLNLTRFYAHASTEPSPGPSPVH